MIIFLLLIFLLGAFFSLLLYRLHGKRKIFSFDLVQFFYVFLIAPTMFLWLKALFFMTVRMQIPHNMPLWSYFLADSIISVISLYIFGAFSIHGVTSVFKTEKFKDPLIDMYRMSEYFHLWWSHIAMYAGGFLLATVMAVLNLFYPNPVLVPQWQILVVSGGGILFGLLVYCSLLIADPMQRRSFLRLMKLLIGALCSLFFILFYIYTPSYDMQFAVFWFVSFMFATTAVCAMTIARTRMTTLIRKKFVHQKWGKNVDLFMNDRKKGRNI